MVTEASREAKPDFSNLIKTFGTHYAFATTMGQRGQPDEHDQLGERPEAARPVGGHLDRGVGRA